MTYLSDDKEDNGQVVTRPNQAVIDELFQHLTTLSAQLKSAMELSSLLQAQYTTATSALKSKVSALESQVSSTQCPLPVESTPSSRAPAGTSSDETECAQVVLGS
jgi:hypothetical protein